MLCCTLGSLAAPAGAAEACRGEGQRPSAANAVPLERATLCLIDRIRAAHGVVALRANGQLGDVAAGQVAAMVRWDYFADLRPGGQTLMSLVEVAGYPAHAVGQNIAWGARRYASPAHIVGEWMASPPHREIILSPTYRDTGVAIEPALPAVLHAGRNGATYAMEFAVRQ